MATKKKNVKRPTKPAPASPANNPRPKPAAPKNPPAGELEIWR
jgi:hypothetical protein